MSLNAIPRELFLQIAANTNIDDLDKVTDKIAGISLSKLSEERRDPNRYFWDLVSDTQKLLRSMYTTNTFLSGSRAAEHFYPSACVADSNWTSTVKGTHFM